MVRQRKNGQDIAKVNDKIVSDIKNKHSDYSEAAITRALHYTGNSSSEAALKWLKDHAADDDIDEYPLVPASFVYLCEGCGIEKSKEYSNEERLQRHVDASHYRRPHRWLLCGRSTCATVVPERVLGAHVHIDI